MLQKDCIAKKLSRSQSMSSTDQLPLAVQTPVTLLSDWLPMTRYPW